MVSIGHSQNTSKEDRVKISINKKGDTITTISYQDTKLILKDLLDYKKTKKILSLYEVKEVTYNNIIEAQNKKIINLNFKNNNLNKANQNFKSILYNKELESKLLNDNIKKLNKEIRKQKTKKVIGFIGAGILVVTIIITK